MKTILCYGDSNTWGYNAETAGRFPPETRWPKVLARDLGEGYTIIPEGLNGRTTVWADPVEGEHKNGKTYLIPCLESHYPLDLVIVMLGTNDLKHRYGLSAWDIASGAGTLVEMIQGSAFGPGGGAPRVLLMAPPPTCVAGTLFEEMFPDSDEKSRDLGRQYGRVAAELGCEFFDASTAIASSKVDGIHLEPGEQVKLGMAVAAVVRKILG
jgi:lysophospholipase L1-like esterase